MSSIKNIAWREPDDWKAAMDLWLRRDYAAAAAAFNQAVTDYSGIASIEDSIGAQALYYYMECLRRNGNFKGMIAPFVQVQKVNLSDYSRMRCRYSVVNAELRSRVGLYVPRDIG